MLINSYADIKESYDIERYKNSDIYNLRKKDIYEEHRKLKAYDHSLIDLYTDLSLKSADRQKKIDEIKKLKDKYIKDNNIDPDYDKPIYTCEKCKDTGFVDGKKCECYKKKELMIFAKVLDAEKIDKKYDLDNIDYTLYAKQNIEMPSGAKYDEYIKTIVDVFKKKIEKIDENPFNMVLCGSTGVGKTYLAKCIVNYMYKNGKTILYIKMPEYIDMLFDKNRKKYNYDIEDMMDMAELVVIDDFGDEYSSEFSDSRIYNIIDNRLDSDKSTVICTKYSKDDIIKMYDDKIVSRIYNNYILFKLVGRDLRELLISHR
ncbi:MAG: ATP-binding protein [Lachnospiraceae bacterium]|nr:ATP-binding protein [Lachnospiraceae bacterium]